MFTLLGCLFFSVTFMMVMCYIWYSKYHHFKKLYLEELLSHRLTHEDFEREIAVLEGDIATLPPSIELWVVGVVGIMEVLSVPRHSAEKFIEKGVGFPKSFGYVNGVHLWNRDELLQWHKEVYPNTEHLMRT